MAIAIANELAARLRCDRVSVGLIRRNGSIRLRAISHSASFKGQGRLVDAIENAMEEALDQRSSVAYPPLPSTERAVTMAHRALAEIIRVQGTSLISVAMADGKGEPVGAITFERHRNELFDKETLQLAEAIAALLGPIVGLQLRANRLVAGRVIDRVRRRLCFTVRPAAPGFETGRHRRHRSRSISSLAKGEHRVTAKSVLEGEVQRAAVAPFDGFIRAAPVRAGDTVKSGDVLAALEDRDLIFDRLKWRAERDKLVQKQREALAKHDRTNLVILDSQIRQAESQLALAEEKLSRARILAPFDGIVVSGDLSQMLGSPVEKGKTLIRNCPAQFLSPDRSRRRARRPLHCGGTKRDRCVCRSPVDPIADDPKQDHARHRRRGRAEFFPCRGSADRTRATIAAGDGRRSQDRNGATLDRVDLDARRRRMAASRRLEVLALSAGR